MVAPLDTRTELEEALETNWNPYSQGIELGEVLGSELGPSFRGELGSDLGSELGSDLASKRVKYLAHHSEPVLNYG